VVIRTAACQPSTAAPFETREVGSVWIAIRRRSDNKERLPYHARPMQPAFAHPILARAKRAGLFVALACALASSIVAASPVDTLIFRDAEGHERALALEALRSACSEGDITVADPYHLRTMRYRALPLRCVLDQGFATSGGASGLLEQGLLLRALDGYTRPVAGRMLLEPGGYVAFGESDRLAAGDVGSRFSPIDRRRVDPAPFYLVWTGTDQGDPHDTPWPYQLARIEVAPFEEAFPATVPTGLEGEDPGWRGYAVFQAACASCHAINAQGGRVGPDLNVPRSIIDYRPTEQIKAYIRNPQATRYTSMPPHPNLTDADLDALIAYFSAMSARKQDPGRPSTPTGTAAAEGGG